MTKTLEINCEKAWKAIGYGVWILLTATLIFGVEYGYQGVNHPLLQPTMPSIGLPTDQFEKQLNDYVTARNTNNLNYLIYYVSSFFLVIDVIGIGLQINHHYRLLEIKCK